MISWRLAVPSILVAAAVAACITYFATPAPPQHIEADQRSSPTGSIAEAPGYSEVSTNIQPPISEDYITAYNRAAEAILKRAQNAKASADEPLFTGRIPLPRKRPIPRP
jgi:hypothetical protein